MPLKRKTKQTIKKPLTRKTKLKNKAREINNKKKAIISRLLEMTFKVDDYIYKHVPISPRDAALYLTEVCGYKGECSGDKRSLQVIEKLQLFMKSIIQEQQELQDCNLKGTDAQLEDTIDMPKNHIESISSNNQKVFISRTMSSPICSQVVENDLSWIENQRYDAKDIPKNRSSECMTKNHNESSKRNPKIQEVYIPRTRSSTINNNRVLENDLSSIENQCLKTSMHKKSKNMPKNRNESYKSMQNNQDVFIARPTSSTIYSQVVEKDISMTENQRYVSKDIPKNRNKSSKSMPKNRNVSSKRMPKKRNESSKRMPNNQEVCIPRTSSSTINTQVLENDSSWIENQRYECKNMSKNRNEYCKSMPNNQEVFIPRTTSCSIYSQAVENDLSWIENLRYVREISEEEKLPVYYEESFWEDYSLPSDWNNEEMFQ